ncbi:MAG: sialidase family protein [Caldilineaceae bacterium]
MPTPEEITVDGYIGTLAALPDGRIVTFCTEQSGRDNLTEDRPPLWVYLRFSEDGGRTWTAPQPAFQHPAGPGVPGWNFPLVDGDGRLHVFCLRVFSLNRDGEGWHSHLLHTVSADGGQHWMPLQRIDFGAAYTGALNSAVQLRSGRILVPLSYFDPHSTSGMCVSRVVYSDDGGQNWHTSNDCRVDVGGAFMESGAIEPVVIELKSGLVWMLIRTVTGYFWESFSHDGAVWTPPQPTRIVASNAPAGLLRLRDGRILMLWNNLYGEPFRGEGASYARWQLHAALSADEAQTWSVPRLVVQRRPGEPENTHTRYPCPVQTADGGVLVAYHRITRRQTTNNIDWNLVRFDLDWVGMAGG